jgi:hypothetical protein
MRAHKLKEDATKKEIDEHFNTIRLMFPTKQEWRVKEKADIPAPTTSNDDMDLLDDDESPLIKDGSLPPISMDINMVFALPAEFKGVGRRSLRCVSAPRRPCSRILRSQPNT